MDEKRPTVANSYFARGLIVAVAVLIVVGLGVAAFDITRGTESISGSADSSTFLSDWTQTTVQIAATPNPPPAQVSQIAGAPSRLPAALGNFLLNAGRAGHTALSWTFTEARGSPTNLEIEIVFQLQFEVGAVVTHDTFTVFLETQAVVVGAALTFSIYWDSGAVGGTTFETETEVAEACVAVGACP